MKKILAIGLVGLLVGLVVATPAAAEPPQHFYLEKVCSDPTANWCVLQVADSTSPFAALDGGVVWYLGPNVGTVNAHGLLKINSEVLLESTDGSATLSGRFVFSGEQGHFVLGDGTGALEGVMAEGTIGVVDWEAGRFSLDGIYQMQ